VKTAFIVSLLFLVSLGLGCDPPKCERFHDLDKCQDRLELMDGYLKHCSSQSDDSRKEVNRLQELYEPTTEQSCKKMCVVKKMEYSYRASKESKWVVEDSPDEYDVVGKLLDAVPVGCICFKVMKFRTGK